MPGVITPEVLMAVAYPAAIGHPDRKVKHEKDKTTIEGNT